MDELYVPGMQRDAPIRIGAWRPVFQVALYDAAHPCQLAAYLVMPAREQLHLDEVVALRRAEIAVAQPRELGVAVPAAGLGYEGLVEFLVADEPVLKLALRGRGGGAAEGPVCLVYLTVPEHRRHPLQRLGCLGEHDDAADRPVKAVGYAHEHAAGLAVTLRHEGLHRLGQALVTRPVALDYLSRPLVHDKQVVVLVQYPAFQVPVLVFTQCPVIHPHSFSATKIGIILPNCQRNRMAQD